MDLIITNGTVLTMNSTRDIIENGAISVEDGIIAAAGPAGEIPVPPGVRVIDAQGGIILPGLINSHTHAAMTLFRGMADDLPLMTWLNDHIFPAEARMDAEMVYSGSRLACAEMLLSGTTCFCDMYLFADDVARAADTAGIRAVVGEVLYDFPSPCYGTLDKGFERVEAMMNTWRNHPRISVAVEPHATYTCAPELLQQAAKTARDHQALLVVHVAETRSEVSGIRDRYGTTPVAHLSELDILSSNLLACHSVHLTPEELDLYTRHGVKVAHCPESNMKLASGIAPVPKMIEKGICVALGTDGCASNNDLDLFGEMNTAAILHKVAGLDPEAISARTAVEMATINGAQALGMADRIGSLVPGKEADIIIVDTGKPHMVPMYNPYSQLVYAARGSDVSTTIVRGEVLVEKGILTRMDTQKVMDEVRRIAAGFTPFIYRGNG